MWTSHDNDDDNWWWRRMTHDWPRSLLYRVCVCVQQLHWLPVKSRIMFKIATIMHNIFHHRSPPYLKDLVTFCVNDSQHRQLQSSSTGSDVVCRTRTQFGRRAFLVCGPDVWNSLPATIRLIDKHAAFRRAIKISLGRLLWVDLIKWVSNVHPSVRTSVPPQKCFFDFNEIWYVGRGRRVMHDGMQSRSRSRALESRKFGHFQRLSPPPFTMGAGKWPRILKLGANT